MTTTRLRRRAAALVLATAVLSLASLTRAADEPDRPSPSPWQVDALPYGWLPGNFGTATVRGNTVHVAVTPVDVYQLLEDGNAFAASGYFALAYGRLSVFDDSSGGYAEETVDERVPTPLCCSVSVRATSELRYVINDAALGYELGRWPLPGRTRALTLGVYAGARTMWFHSKVSAKAGVAGGVQKAANVSESFTWSDPLIGVRWSAPLFEPVSLDFRGDVGGFGASSNFVWGISTALKVWIPWRPWSLQPYAALGYRIVDFDRSSSDGHIDLAFRGPTMGAGFVF